MRTMILCAALGLTACASAPTDTKVASAAPAASPAVNAPASAAPNAPTAANAGAPAAAAEPAADSDEARQAKADTLALKNGYRIKKNDGVHTYCKTWPVTESRIRKQTTCLTALQMQQQEQRNTEEMTHPAFGQTSTFNRPPPAHP